MTATTTSSVLDYFRRFEVLRDIGADTKAKNEKLIQELIDELDSSERSRSVECRRLATELEEAQLDLSDATKSRRELQQNALLYDNELSRLTMENERLKMGLAATSATNPYVAILIDGDGLNFHDHFIRQGVEGGIRAAKALQIAVQEQCGDQAHETEVVAKILVNLSGLAKTLTTAVSHRDLKQFTLGFTQSMPLFDVVDVGVDRDSAVDKLKETTKWHLRNFNCRQVLLGISHDAGFAPFMGEILAADELTRQRVTVIEGVPTVKELKATGVNTFKLPRDIFRTDRLLDRSLPSSSTTSPSASFASAATPLTAPTSSPFSSYAGIAQAPPLPPQPKSASPPPQMVIPLAPRSANVGGKTRPTGAAMTASGRTQRQGSSASSILANWNPGPRGLDEPIPVDPIALDTVKKRKDNNKLCNNHFLRGPCSKGDACSFVHKYKPTADELAAIAYLSRLNPCTSGQDCEADDCIYGHHCPSLREDGWCTHPYCKFPLSAHPPNTKFKNGHIDKNN